MKTSEQSVVALKIHNCVVIRKKFIAFGFMGATGFEKQGEEWREGPCNTPLFTEQERTSGQCRSCASGWNHPNNYFANQPRPTEYPNEK